ncbi:polysaccharide deacetylase family protein [Leptolinea tardivitalis]|nr:polysaccharide deacetylase family protein [Leptolinea tardivitalis]
MMLLSACGSSFNTVSAQPEIDLTKQFQDALLTATYGVPAPTATPAPPTETPVPTVDPNITPPPLPEVYRSQFLKPVDIPRTYISDTCTYLKNRWDPNKSAPGTIVMPIMFHGIAQETAAKENDITSTNFKILMKSLNELGFQAINMKQFVDFMYDNAKIPNRSVLLIVDDRHYAQYFDQNFKPYYDKWGWPVINAWISFKDNTQDLIQDQRNLVAAGYVDYQAHGVVHNIPIGNNSTDEYIKSEIVGSKESMQRDIGVTPIAYIWPGGGFSKRGAEIAREAGYKAGFTTNPRSPVMYNWIPQADEVDLQRPGYAPEGPAGDPMMTLPRFWDTDAYYRLDEVRLTGKEAAAAAEQSKASELAYYDIVCKAKTGEIPTLAAQ